VVQALHPRGTLFHQEDLAVVALARRSVAILLLEEVVVEVRFK